MIKKTPKGYVLLPQNWQEAGRALEALKRERQVQFFKRHKAG